MVNVMAESSHLLFVRSSGEFVAVPVLPDGQGDSKSDSKSENNSGSSGSGSRTGGAHVFFAFG